jgi:hypothetical protein
MSGDVMFSDSIEGNLGLIEEVLRGLPGGQRNQAKLAAVTIEKAFNSIQKDSQGNAGAALGTAYAIYKIAQKLVEGGKGSQTSKIIQLLN